MNIYLCYYILNDVIINLYPILIYYVVYIPSFNSYKNQGTVITLISE